MKCLRKGLSVLLSLVLCGSMIAPAFAATFSDLEHAISGSSDGKPTGDHGDGTVISTEGSPDRYGYAWNEQANNGSGHWGIEAWDGDDGTRNVQLNENVTRTDPDKPTDSDSVPSEPIAIETGDKVVIDTQGNTIDGQGKYANAIFDVSGDLTVKGGTIQGGNNGYNSGGAIRVETGATATLDGVEVTNNTAAVNGGAISADRGATVNLKDTTVTGNTAAENGNGDGIYAADGATVNLTGKTEVSGNGEGDNSEDVYLADGAELDGSGLKPESTPVPVWTDESGKTQDVTSTVTGKEGSHSLTWTEPEEPVDPIVPDDKTDDTNTDVELPDPEVPLAEGPITCAEFIHKMWVLDGEPAPLDDRGLPEGVGEDHEYAQAIAWAVSADIVSVEGFDLEELLSVGLARELLTGFAAYADMAMPELTTLTGKDGDLVLNSDEVLDEFFGEKDSE